MASANMKDIKRRIKSVKSTMQITKAMELVASSKLRKARDKADSAKLFFDALYDTMWEITDENDTFKSIYFSGRQVKTVMFVVIAGDRGLAGGYNANVLKLAQQKIDQTAKEYEVVVIPIGKKAVEYFTKRGYKVVAKYENIAENIRMNSAKEIGSKIMAAFKNGNTDRVELIYTDYVSPLVQLAKHKSIIPLEKPEEKVAKKLHTSYEPAPEALFELIMPQYIAGVLYGSIADSFASEQAARRIAMENASDNATEMIDELSLLYNRARQSTITQEITEIVGGANVQE
ncbi:MAG: ATP synthase F1 subunit gamma [Oscillospiraceae bacterium]|nr:ATP synthase F1 subunit gamma [Ruminococcus sp.]MBP1564203.1 ATP synthase F1 subunit gamma [Oscillospiraceae bacterium]MBQ9981230.1 ATP synthase F1 subunit gamma [Oscillospiraceae bacterium]